MLSGKLLRGQQAYLFQAVMSSEAERNNCSLSIVAGGYFNNSVFLASHEK